MNSRIPFYLPLSLLLSTAIYAMDNETKKIEDKKLTEEVLITSLAAPVHMPPATTASGSKSESSVKAELFEEKKAPTSKIAQRLRDSNWIPLFGRGEADNVMHELENKKFDKSDTDNMHRLERTLESYTTATSTENLAKLCKALSLCKDQKIAINTESVAKNVFSYVRKYKSTEEAQLKKTVFAYQKKALEESMQSIQSLTKFFEETVKNIETKNKECQDGCNAAFKSHQPIIKSAYEGEESIDDLNELLDFPNDYKVEVEDCNEKFLEQHLGLTQPTQELHDKIELMMHNLKNIAELIKVADKKAIEPKSNKTAFTQHEPQPQQ